MAIIDPHHHLWDLNEVHYPGLVLDDKTAFFGSYEAMARNYLPEDYLYDAKDQHLVKSVHIQAEADHREPLTETRWLSGLASHIPSAIVAYVDLSRDDAARTLERQCEFDKLRGIRQILNYHPDPMLSYTPHNLLDDDRWQSNFSLLSRHGLSFDLQIYYQQMRQAATLAVRHSDIQIILNHTGMPVERTAEGLAGWRAGMRLLAACDNVAVKISGLGMTDPAWTTESLQPFVLETIDTFGIDRCMFASNFPVDRLFSDYDTLYIAYRTITRDLSSDERHKLFYKNAEVFYRI